MKTLKLTIIAVFLTFAMVSAANADDSKNKTARKVVYMNLDKAIHIYWLDMILRELDSDFLSSHEPTYTVEVPYHDYIVRVTGTYDQWVWYFRPKGVDIDNPPNPPNLKHQIRWR